LGDGEQVKGKVTLNESCGYAVTEYTLTCGDGDGGGGGGGGGGCGGGGGGGGCGGGGGDDDYAVDYPTHTHVPNGSCAPISTPKSRNNRKRGVV
jgi:hypothetical protein